MNKYTELSDFEINCSVLAIFAPSIRAMSLSEDGNSFYHCGIAGDGFYEVCIPDYCNSPVDAMPIIIENGISILHRARNSTWYAYHLLQSAENKSLYRAAMEVFLMMKDAENEND